MHAPAVLSGEERFKSSLGTNIYLVIDWNKMSRYIIPSSDVSITVGEEGKYGFYPVQTEVLRTDAFFLCSECGSIVYRTDLHDKWHKEYES